MNNTEKRLAELAIFWQEIADNLPKSLERSALGDEKMFLAFASVYPKMAEHLEQEMLKRVRGEIEEIHTELHNGRTEPAYRMICTLLASLDTNR